MHIDQLSLAKVLSHLPQKDRARLSRVSKQWNAASRESRSFCNTIELDRNDPPEALDAALATLEGGVVIERIDVSCCWKVAPDEFLLSLGNLSSSVTVKRVDAWGMMSPFQDNHISTLLALNVNGPWIMTCDVYGLGFDVSHAVKKALHGSDLTVYIRKLVSCGEAEEPPMHSEEVTGALYPVNRSTQNQSALMLQSARRGSENFGTMPRLVLGRGIGDGFVKSYEQLTRECGIRSVGNDMLIDRQLTGPIMRSISCGMRVLRLPHNGIDDNDIAVVANILERGECCLAELDIFGSAVSTKGALLLASALQAASQNAGRKCPLEAIDLGNSSIGDGGAQPIAFACKTPGSKLTRVSLAGAMIGEHGARRLAGAVQNGSITRLNLANNKNVGSSKPALKSLADSLPCLEVLDLTKCRLGDEGIFMIVERLRESKQLAALSVAANDIGDEGAAALARALRGSSNANGPSSLLTVDLMANNLEPCEGWDYRGFKELREVDREERIKVYTTRESRGGHGPSHNLRGCERLLLNHEVDRAEYDEQCDLLRKSIIS